MPPGMHRQGAAAGLGPRRNDLEAVGGEDAGRGGVHVAKEDALDAAR